MGETAVRRGRMTAAEAAAAQGRIAATTGWEGFADCDLIVEAIVEDVAAKRTLFRELAGVARADVVLTSNSSALPIEAIAGEVPHPARTLGLHFFNPVGRMPLVELVLGPQTGAAAAGQVLRWLQAIGKAPVVCRSSPGFLVTRVLFFYLNAAVRRWEDGVPAAAIEAALRDFGWPMGPLRLIDEVGLDVTVAIFAELERSFPHRFRRSSACDRLLAAGRRGRKGGGGAGFHDGGGRETVDEAALRAIVGGAAGPAAAPPDLAAELMDVMAAEAQRCLDEGVVRSPDDIDFALLSGAGFPKFRGGLMRWARAATAAVSRS
jgi:3-hydroxyacyl-CoA dehydrogenase